MLVGYMRVSKADGSQSLELQKDALLKAWVEEDRIYHDLATGRHDKREGLENCLKALQPGNTIVVWRLDRLGRSLKDLIAIVDGLQAKNIGFKVFSGAGVQIDTTTPNGRLVFNIFGALTEFERELISERTKAGIAAARTRGRLGGRRPKMDKQRVLMASHAMSDRETKASDVAKKLGITTTTLYNYINGDGSLKEAGHKVIKG